MRITPGMIGSQLLGNLQGALAALARQQDHLSSARRILAPSDDPGGAAQALGLRSRQAAIEQFQKNVAEARTGLQAADSVLRSVLETVIQAKEVAVQGASDTNDALARRALGDQVNQLLEALVAQANSRSGGGTYLFGGQESTVAPYTVTRDGSGRMTAVTVNPRGIAGSTLAEVSEGVAVTTGISGTTVFGASTDSTFAFDVLIRLRDNLNANAAGATQTLGFVADVSASGASNSNRYLGIDSTTDLQIAGPRGTAYVGLTSTAADTVSAVGNATSAIATTAAINAVSATTGVTAAATPAQLAVSGAFAVDVNIDGSSGRTLVINGTSLSVNLTGASATARRDALVTAINAQVTGVTATASGASDFVLTAADGRNISVRTDGATGVGTVNTEVFGFTTGLAAETVVARGGVTLGAVDGSLTTTAAAGAAFADQVTGEGTATGARAALDELDAVLDRATTASTEVGVRLGWLGLVEERLGSDSLGLAGALSRIEDLDIPKAVQELLQTQTSYEAALASGSKLLRLSLLDFLR